MNRFVSPCAGLLLALGLSSSVTATAPPTPLHPSGFNDDVVVNAAGDAADAFDGSPWYKFYKSGFRGNGNGLVGGTFASRVTNTVTGGHTSFQFQPFESANALMLSSALSLALPGAEQTPYASLAILAASGSADSTSGLGDVVIHFTDGTSATTTFNAFDWWAKDSTRQAAQALNGPGPEGEVGRFVDFNSGSFDNPVFGLYETDINLTDLNGVDYSAKSVQCLTFSRVPGAATTGVFAISASAAVPEPAGLSLLAPVATAACMRRRQRHG